MWLHLISETATVDLFVIICLKLFFNPELVKNALQEWLPAQEEFDKFASEEQEPKPKSK